MSTRVFFLVRSLTPQPDPPPPPCPAPPALPRPPPPAEPLRIVSPSADPAAVLPDLQPERKTPTVSESATAPNGQAKTSGPAASPRQAPNKAPRPPALREVPALIEQAEVLRTALRDLTLKTNELVKALKRHRHRSRAVAHTLASLRQLKGIGV